MAAKFDALSSPELNDEPPTLSIPWHSKNINYHKIIFPVDQFEIVVFSKHSAISQENVRLVRLSDLQSMANWHNKSAAQMMHRLIDALRVAEIDSATRTNAPRIS